MARFRFPLQAVLRYREHVERQKMLGVARLEVERRTSEGVIREYQRKMREGKDHLRRALAPGDKPVDPRAARQQAVASLHLQLKAQRAALGLAGVLKRLGEARAVLAQASVERRAMEKLRENRLESWQTEDSRREGHALDEIGTLGAARRLIEEPGTESERTAP